MIFYKTLKKWNSKLIKKIIKIINKIVGIFPVQIT